MLSGVEVRRDFAFGKFEFKNNLLYQYSTDPDILSVPDIIGNHSLIFNFSLMEGTMKNKIGLELTYNSKFKNSPWIINK